MRSDHVQDISAVTLAVRDMARSVEFYEKLGFELFYGGPRSGFSSFKSREAVLNLAAQDGRSPQWWGRIIFRVADADACYESLKSAGLSPEAPPRDAPWGERFFHLRDPDGHELSFAELL